MILLYKILSGFRSLEKVVLCFYRRIQHCPCRLGNGSLISLVSPLRTKLVSIEKLQCCLIDFGYEKNILSDFLFRREYIVFLGPDTAYIFVI